MNNNIVNKIFGYMVAFVAVLSFLVTQWYVHKVESAPYLEFIAVLTQIVTFISGIVITKLKYKE